MSDEKPNALIVRKETITAIDLSARDAASKLMAIREFQRVVKESMIDGHDFGTIPGTPKPTLLKPGAEKIAKLLNLYDHYTILKSVEDWDKPFFYYQVECILSDIAAGVPVSSGMGSCNSLEKKYAFRWIREDQVSRNLNKETLESMGGKQTMFEFDFALEKRETEGKYGKPKEHWLLFDKEIQGGRAKHVQKETKTKKLYWGQEIAVDTTMFKVPSPDIFDQVNTFLKMAKKRALVDAALSVGRLSDLFTQDIEDIYGDAYEPIQNKAEKEPEPSSEEAAQPAPANEEKPTTKTDKRIHGAKAGASTVDELPGGKDADFPGYSQLAVLRDELAGIMASCSQAGVIIPSTELARVNALKEEAEYKKAIAYYRDKLGAKLAEDQTDTDLFKP
jgi:hypothetical protein